MHRSFVVILIFLLAMPIAGVNAQGCVSASYSTWKEQMRPGESGYLASVYVQNMCSGPTNLILKLITVDGDPSNDVEVPAYLKPGEGKTYDFKTFIPSYYEDKELTFYVEIYQNVGSAYALVGTLPKLKLIVFPNFTIVVRSYNATVRAGEKILAGILASEEAVNSLYDATAYLISPGKRIRLQVIKLNLYPNRETKFYVDVPNSTQPGTYSLHFEIHKKKYKLSESDPLTDPEVTILPAVTTTWKTTTQPTTTEEMTTTITTTTTVPEETQTTSTLVNVTITKTTAAPLSEVMMVVAIAMMVAAIALLTASVMLLRRRAHPSPSG